MFLQGIIGNFEEVSYTDKQKTARPGSPERAGMQLFYFPFGFQLGLYRLHAVSSLRKSQQTFS